MTWHSAPIADGTTCADHVPHPPGYMQAWAWAEVMLAVAEQRRCAGCHGYDIWVAKPGEEERMRKIREWYEAPRDSPVRRVQIYEHLGMAEQAFDEWVEVANG